jgi:hypothetical protein
MAFVVGRAGQYEVRESRATPAGPRATTLATFRVLDDGVLRRARARAERAFDDDAVRRRARALGAPVAAADVVLAARGLLVELDRGASVPPALRAELLERLGAGDVPEVEEGLGDGLDDALPWVAVSDGERGRALRDVLALTDSLPAPRPSALRFPRVESSGG